MNIDSKKLEEKIKQHQLAVSLAFKYLAPVILFLDNWVEFRESFGKQNDILEQRAIKILYKYKWLITPTLPQSLILNAVKIGERKGYQYHKINHLFVEYYSSNKFEHLESLVDGWAANDFFKPRMKILKDCVFTMKNKKGNYNPSNVVLPTLIAQIDGILNAFMREEMLEPKNKKWWDKENKKRKEKKGKRITRKEWYKHQTQEYHKFLYFANNNQTQEYYKFLDLVNNNQTQEYKLLELANRLIFNVLFQNTKPNKKLKNAFTFNRHKILHSEKEYLRYGKIDNTVRAFLILDLLAIITKNKKGNLE